MKRFHADAMKSAIRSANPGADVKPNLAMTLAPGDQLNHQPSVEAPMHPQKMKRLLAAASTAMLSGVLGAACWSAQAAPSKSAKAVAATNAPMASLEVEIPQSVFVIPVSPKEGRNPFFPHSTAVQPTQRAKEAIVDTSAIVLNGITSKPFPSVMINGMTFEKGEEHEVKVPNGGKVKVRCEDIRADSALVLVNGVQRELRMRLGL